MSILDGSIASELERWNRTESPLVTASRSIRNEDSANPSNENGSGDDTAGNSSDPFDGIALDDLPAEVRDTVVAARERFTLLQTTAAQTAKERDAAVQQARQHQSRADSFHNKLKAHNLLDQSGNPANPQPQGDPMRESVISKLMTEKKMDRATAEQWADIMGVVMPVYVENTVNQVAHTLTPLVQSVGNIQADRALNEFAGTDTTGLMQVPAIAEAVTSGVKAIVSQNGHVDANIIKNLMYMSYGELQMTNPSALESASNPQPQNPMLHHIVQPQPTIRVSGRATPPGAIMPRPAFGGNPPGNGAPMAKDPETARAVAATLGYMLSGVNVKKK